jgi:hypothetical protein
MTSVAGEKFDGLPGTPTISGAYGPTTTAIAMAA